MKKRFFSFLLALCMILMLAPAAFPQAEAANVYKTVYSSSETQQIGSRYFKVTFDKNNNATVSMALSKTGTYHKTGLTLPFETDGLTKAYYIKNNVLYVYKFSGTSGKSVKLLDLTKKLPGEDSYFHVAALTKGILYLTLYNYEDYTCTTYQYTIKTKAFKVAAKNCSITDFSGSIVVGFNTLATDVSAMPLTLYKATSTGLTKVKKLSSKSYGAYVSGSTVYYEASYGTGDKYSENGLKVFTCNGDGTGKKTIANITSEYGDLMLTGLTDTYVTYYENGSEYKYDFALKETGEIIK